MGRRKLSLLAGGWGGVMRSMHVVKDWRAGCRGGGHEEHARCEGGVMRSMHVVKVVKDWKAGCRGAGGVSKHTDEIQ